MSSADSGSEQSEGPDSESELEEYTNRTLWRASESPVESFSDAEGGNENGEWAVELIGEEVDMYGDSRYEARWENWTRPDGSNITWDNDLLHIDDIKLWKHVQNQKRKALVDQSLDIEIWATTDIVNTATRLRSQAYDEKLRKRKKGPLGLSQRMAKLLAEKLPDEYEDLRPSLRRSERASSIATSSSSRSSTTLKTGSYLTPSASFTSTPPTRLGTPKGKRNPTPRSPSRPLPEVTTEIKIPRIVRPLPSRSQSSHTPKILPKRQELEHDWNRAAKSWRAASIKITNDVDDEEIPDLVPHFQYLESGYIYSKDIQKPDDSNMFVRCDCDTCSRAPLCSCQEPSELQDMSRQKMYAYTVEGLFAFNVPSGVEVIECNKFCQCDLMTCQNRVAQLPRDVPIEIFKTPDCGWGVRAPVHIERGKVLGIYTGLLIPRETAGLLVGDEGAYCFDLDGKETPEEESLDHAYSVDSRTCGNWTRFINHSCSPNLRVYLVVYDTIPERNTPYLAFVAVEDIHPGTEFTFDYDPSAVKVKAKGKGKGKIKIPEGAKPCMCNTDKCRGWVRV